MIRNFGASGIGQQPQGIDLGLGGGSNIKSIQRGSYTFAGANSSATIPISQVDLTKAIVRISTSTQYNNVAAWYGLVRATLSNSTTISLSKKGNGYDINVDWEVIEFNNVKSLQSGTTNPVNGPLTVSSVNPNKSMLVFSYGDLTDAASSDESYCYASAILANPTTINFHYLAGGGTSFLYSWYLIEFN